MKTNDTLVKISKMLSKHLRHKPDALGIRLEPGGWADVDILIQAFANKGFELTRETLETVVTNNDKQRFSFNEDSSKIRANQGHSVEVDLELEPQTPPVILFHGTASDRVTSILENGIQKMNRHHVHLSSEIQTAVAVGSRYGKPVVLEIAAQDMSNDGHVFYCSSNGVWLLDEVPVKYLSLREKV